MEVDPEQVSQYGCAAIKPTDDEDVVTVTDLVEKPVPGEAPSNWIVIGRYVCDPADLRRAAARPRPGRGGEIQLTDALRTLATATRPTAAGCTACCSAAAATTPATSSTTCAPWSSSPASAPDLAQEFVPWLRRYLDTLP